MTTQTTPRVPWPAQFPDVVVHHAVKTRTGHPAYAEAKAGDPDAAHALIDALLAEVSIPTQADR